MAAPASAPAAELPSDPDTDVDDAPVGPPVPAPLHLASLALVFVGGTFGTAGREALTLLIPPSGGVPWAVLAANLVGAFALGVLLEGLVRRGADHGARRTLRLLFGTGFLGGFTTYSALAGDTAALIGAGDATLATVYAIGTVLVGVVATGAGVALAAAVHGRRSDLTGGADDVALDAGGGPDAARGPDSARGVGGRQGDGQQPGDTGRRSDVGNEA